MTSTTILEQDWYQSLVDDCSSIIIEKEFESRFSLIEGYHELGSRILIDENKFDYGIDEAINRISKSIGKGRRTIYYAVKFAKTYPSLESLKIGKNASWNKVLKMITEPKEEMLIALPDNESMKKIIIKNIDWLVENLNQNKKGINLFLPNEKFENEIL